MADNDNGGLSDADVERIAESLFRKLSRALVTAAAAATAEAACESAVPVVKPSTTATKPTLEDFAALNAHRRRLGRGSK